MCSSPAIAHQRNARSPHLAYHMRYIQVQKRIADWRAHVADLEALFAGTKVPIHQIDASDAPNAVFQRVRAVLD